MLARSDAAAMSKAEIIEEIAILEELERRESEPLRTFSPYKKQLEFYASTDLYAETCLMAGNQVGKTLCASAMIAYHLTGDYPDWWTGVRFDDAPIIWICGETGEVIRDTSQKYLVGRPGELEGNGEDYTGLIPRRKIVEAKKAQNSNGLLDYIVVKHKSGKKSYGYFKAYAKGREKFQGETIDFTLLDEEPPPTIYSEALTRTNNGQKGRRAALTFTPLKGMSEVVYSFLQEPTRAQNVVRMTIDDAEHYSDEERQAIVDGYKDYEREARAKGIPIMGSGLVYQIAERHIKEPRIELVPNWWREIAGMDFGYDHPSAAVYILYDPDKDVVHVRSTHRVREASPLMFAAGVKPWGSVPFAWPHDGLQHDKGGSGEQLASQYRDAGLNMLPERATHAEGGNGVEAGIMEILDRMKSGRFFVDESCVDWFEEMRLYHRKEGKIVKVRDDLLDATRYAVMMLRYARPLYDMPTEALMPEPDEVY